MATGDAAPRETQRTQGKSKAEGEAGAAGRQRRQRCHFDGTNHGRWQWHRRGAAPAHLGKGRKRRGDSATAGSSRSSAQRRRGRCQRPAQGGLNENAWRRCLPVTPFPPSSLPLPCVPCVSLVAASHVAIHRRLPLLLLFRPHLPPKTRCLRRWTRLWHCYRCPKSSCCPPPTCPPPYPPRFPPPSLYSSPPPPPPSLRAPPLGSIHW